MSRCLRVTADLSLISMARSIRVAAAAEAGAEGVFRVERSVFA